MTAPALSRWKHAAKKSSETLVPVYRTTLHQNFNIGLPDYATPKPQRRKTVINSNLRKESHLGNIRGPKRNRKNCKHVEY